MIFLLHLVPLFEKDFCFLLLYELKKYINIPLFECLGLGYIDGVISKHRV